jgi:hypothetical protein
MSATVVPNCKVVLKDTPLAILDKIREVVANARFDDPARKAVVLAELNAAIREEIIRSSRSLTCGS